MSTSDSTSSPGPDTETRVDVFFSGRLAEGVSAEQAAARLAQLFKTRPEKLAHLFTGKPALIKRDLSRAQALQYREALRRAGMEAAFRRRAAPAQAQAGELSLAPPGESVLRPEERPRVEAVRVNTEHLRLAPVFGDFTASDTAPDPVAPDTAHISLAPAGSEVLRPEERPQHEPVDPDLSGYALAPPGSDLGPGSTEPAPTPPDTSDLSLAPEGEDLLRAGERRQVETQSVDTAHIKLAPPD